jgi:hypothetical protein
VYGLFAAGTTGFAWYATRQRVELVSDDYYARSLAHDERMIAVANANALGDDFKIDVSDDGRALALTWPSRLSGVHGHVRLYRASDATADHVFPLEPDRENRQRFSLHDLPAGHWSIQLDWVAAGDAYYVERAVTLR